LNTPQTATVASEPRGEDDEGTEEQKEIGSKVFDTDEITPENAWAIGLLSKSHLNPLMEALDPDGSGHVTIKEINDFTSSRPQEWRYIHSFLFVSHALIYFLQPPTVGRILDCRYVGILNRLRALSNDSKRVGFEVTLRQYCYRIRNRFSEIYSLSDSLIPGNAGVFSAVMTFRILENVIVRVHTIDADDIEDEYQNPSFQAYAEGIEKQLEERLKRLNYLIDDMNTLSLLTGPGRLEEVCGNRSAANLSHGV
jgi:hypothetical protein